MFSSRVKGLNFSSSKETSMTEGSHGGSMEVTLTAGTVVKFMDVSEEPFFHAVMR